ncbi:uncharacterized protein SOCEGT47_031780 [Sorangium cellulosum]|uniref:Uncharacterized protein n=1 Tax=Sorangium cellulosum TaxID=56 RepID=A0A4P2Q0E7_SORCE|nr:uncharacterized protein SOCEGT47_031780 [Sorangium cellulosum]
MTARFGVRIVSKRSPWDALEDAFASPVFLPVALGGFEPANPPRATVSDAARAPGSLPATGSDAAKAPGSLPATGADAARVPGSLPGIDSDAARRLAVRPAPRFAPA